MISFSKLRKSNRVTRAEMQNGVTGDVELWASFCEKLFLKEYE
jgi:hypothetical protein